jgi:hypothetical protein
MFANKIKKIVTVKDGDEEVAVTIRKLSARSLDKAQLAKQAQVAGTARNLGPDMVDAFQKAAARDEAVKVVDPAEARFNSYDREATLIAGIDSWDVPGISVADGVPELDEETAEFLFRAIIELSVPTPEEAEAAQGKS